MFTAFEDVVVKDLIPMIDATYRTIPDRAFSSAPNTKPASGLIPDPDAARKQLKLLWIACGNKDNLLRISQGMHAYLKEKDIPHVWHVDGHGHDATEWGNNLYYFAQHIFR